MERSVSGILIACGLVLSLAGLVWGLLNHSGSAYTLGVFTETATWTLIYGASKQALISTLCSLIVGGTCARAIHRRGRLFGKKLILATSFLAMVLPTTAAAVSLISLWGRNGAARGFVESFIPDGILFAPYGLGMVVLAHVLFNAPIALRVCLSVLQTIPTPYMKLGASLGFGSLSYWRFVEWPAIKKSIPVLFGLIFLLCFSSFPLVLMLGGGPAVSTLEVAIYTAIRFDFDLARGGALALLQLVFASSAIILISWAGSLNWSAELNETDGTVRKDTRSTASRMADGATISLYCTIVVLPVLSMMASVDFDNSARLFTRDVFWEALISSVTLGVAAALLSTALAFLLADAHHKASHYGFMAPFRGLINVSISIYLAVPSVVLGTSMFLALRGTMNLFGAAFFIVLASNTLMCLPFAARLIFPKYSSVFTRADKLCLSLNIKGFHKFWMITLPSMRNEIGLSLGLCSALAMGDFGVIALFGSEQFRTLPWLLYQYSSRYGGSEAELLGLIMLGLALMKYFMFSSILKLPTIRTK
jgi:thiamine transport system permease protein